MITRLSLVTILVRDQDEALRWFTEILGLKKLQDASYGGDRNGSSSHLPSRAISVLFFRSLNPRNTVPNERA